MFFNVERERCTQEQLTKYFHFKLPLRALLECYWHQERKYVQELALQRERERCTRSSHRARLASSKCVEGSCTYDSNRVTKGTMLTLAGVWTNHVLQLSARGLGFDSRSCSGFSIALFIIFSLAFLSKCLLFIVECLLFVLLDVMFILDRILTSDWLVRTPNWIIFPHELLFGELWVNELFGELTNDLDLTSLNVWGSWFFSHDFEWMNLTSFQQHRCQLEVTSTVHT